MLGLVESFAVGPTGPMIPLGPGPPLGPTGPGGPGGPGGPKCFKIYPLKCSSPLLSEVSTRSP